MQLQAWLQEMLSSHFIDMFRYKGILALKAEDDGHEFDVAFQVRRHRSDVTVLERFAWHTAGVAAWTPQLNTVLLLQGVHDVADFVPRDAEPGTKRSSRMVFIGKDLPEEDLRQGFLQCLAS